MSNDQRFLKHAILVGSACFGIALLWVDGRLAQLLSHLSPQITTTVRTLTTATEVLFGFPTSPYLYGAIILIMGGVMLARHHRAALPLLFVGSVHTTARFLADIMKPPFSRLRPHEALSPHGWNDEWFASVGNSFPSGHAVHFWSLFFPLALLFPRYRLPLAILPVLISAARVAVNDHYVSDVIASAVVSAIVAWGFVLFRERRTGT